MKIRVDVCRDCYLARHVGLMRCERCLVLGCLHMRDRVLPAGKLRYVVAAGGAVVELRNFVCLTKIDECEARERDRVMSAWIFELLADGYCVTPTGRIDCHGQRIKLRGDNNFVCAFCEKPAS